MKIFRLQKRTSRVIIDYNVDDFNEAIQSLKIPSVYDRLFLGKAKLMFKVYNGLTISYISENSTHRNEMNMVVNLRSAASWCDVLFLYCPKKERFRQSMRYSGCLIWNCLPNNVKYSQTAETFHNRCIRWLTQWCIVPIAWLWIIQDLIPVIKWSLNLFLYLIQKWKL